MGKGEFGKVASAEVSGFDDFGYGLVNDGTGFLNFAIQPRK
jgi:hypothetical protein